MIPRSFYFLRHGETDWNKEGRLQGWTDTPLNATGEAQAVKAAPAIARLPIDLFVVSPLLRARRTVEILNEQLQKPVIVDARIQERNFGIFEGKLDSEIDAWKKEAALNKNLIVEECGYPQPDNAESYETFKQRNVASIIEHLNNAAGKNIMFVAHGGVYRVLARLLMNNPQQSPNVQPFHFEKTASGWGLHTLPMVY